MVSDERGIVRVWPVNNCCGAQIGSKGGSERGSEVVKTSLLIIGLVLNAYTENLTSALIVNN